MNRRAPAYLYFPVCEIDIGPYLTRVETTEIPTWCARNFFLTYQRIRDQVIPM